MKGDWYVGDGKQRQASSVMHIKSRLIVLEIKGITNKKGKTGTLTQWNFIYILKNMKSRPNL